MSQEKKATSDRCWLGKKVVAPVHSFFVENVDEKTQTIIHEIGELFPSSRQAIKKEASVCFFLEKENELGSEGFSIEEASSQIKIKAQTSKGLLYGFYHFYRKQVQGAKFLEKIISVPSQSIRMLNHWDNFDGSVERGYAGSSIFYHENHFRKDRKRLQQYARLLASIGINALSINNVNVHEKETFFITKEYLKEIKEVVTLFSNYGIQVFLSVNFAAPITVGKLSTADPKETSVLKFWQQTAQRIYQEIPEFGGILVKADSEGQPGPFAYGCNHDEGANMLARAFKPYGGLVIWRCFVYNHKQDWRDRSLDRAKAAYEHFQPLDGAFDENVVLQIKNGPIDFNVREPISPLFGALKQTNQLLELQITQEYTGQQRHLCYLVPSWKRILEFDTTHEIACSKIKDVLKNQSIDPQFSGITAVVNVGMDKHWTGHPLAQANLFGYGRLIWDNALTEEEITQEWLALTFTLSEKGRRTLTKMLQTSWETYESYTAPLGICCTMVTPQTHYGVDVDGYEYSPWGCYHYADRWGIGQNRTVKDGTGFTEQYAKKLASYYENGATCPDETLFFFRRVPYTHLLHSGKTVIQHIYDTHFEGVEKVEAFIQMWETLKEEIEAETFQKVASKLQEQVLSAREWRDQINTYFYRNSGIEDIHQRTIY